MNDPPAEAKSGILSGEQAGKAVALLEEMLNKNPLGQAIGGLNIFDIPDGAVLMIDKVDKIIDLSADQISKRFDLEFFGLPHEVYHAVFDGPVHVEEVLIKALTLVEMYCLSRSGDTDPEHRELFRSISADLTRKSPKREFPNLADLIDEARKFVREHVLTQEGLSPERLVTLFLPLSYRYPMRRIKNLIENVQTDLRSRGECEVLADCCDLWLRHRDLVLRRWGTLPWMNGLESSFAETQ